MRKALFISCLLSIFLLPTTLSAQMPKLAVTAISRTPLDTIFYNGTDVVLQYSVAFMNIGQNKLDGPVRMMVQYPTLMMPEDKGQVSVVDFEVGMMDTISWNDTITGLGGGARYGGGDNILVIWPKADAPALAPDSGYHNVHVLDQTNSIDDIELLKARVQVGPNPATDGLNFRYLKDAHKLEYVRLIGIDGRVHLLSETAMPRIELSAYKQGIYMLELQYKDGVRGTYKILISR